MRSTAHADGWLEGDFSGQLELARVIGCKGDDPEVRAVERGVRLSKDDGVGEVEGLKAQSQRYAIVDRDGAEQGQVEVLVPRVAEGVTAHGAEGAEGGGGEGRGVEPLTREAG